MNGPTPPPPPSARAVLFGLPSAGRRWPGGVRAALAFAIPASIAWVLGFETAALLTVSGSFAVIYGEGRPYRSRWRIVSIAGVALVASVLAGATAGSGSSYVVPVLVLAVVAAIAVYIVAALRLGAPGAFFFVLVCAVSSYLPSAHISPTTAAAWAAAGAVSAALVSMAPVLWAPRAPEEDAVSAAKSTVEMYLSDAGARRAAGSRLHAAWAAVYDAGLPTRNPRPALVQALFSAHLSFAAATHARSSHAVDLDPDPDADVDAPSDVLPLARPSVAYRLRRSLHPQSHAVATATRVFVGALASGGMAVALGLPRPDWAVLGAVLVLQQGPDRVHGSYRGVQRLGGTVLGVALFALVQELSVTGVTIIVVLMALQFLIEISVARNYGLAVVFITPLALLMGSLSHPDASTADVVTDRVIETVLGVLVAFGVLWCVQPHAFRRALGWSDRRVLDLSSELLQHVSTAHPASARGLELRRDVQFELVNSALAGADAAHNDRRWTVSQWTRHAGVDRLGYELLAQCWSVADGRDFGETTPWTARIEQLSTAYKQRT
ncbi:FUSC family protein [Rhodococcoides yunnanense]|uniref:FUSC family protein n=1 Tax=Rhodococcoides yunnanense TaxID=278209 RepID=UPI001475F2EA|nr:FUSC family protein [Rhodococcus yunnanensis]